MTLTVTLPHESYPIYIERGLLDSIGELLSLDRRVLVVTDEGVPKAYADKLVNASKHPVLLTLPAGENTKSLENLEKLLRLMLDHGFTRKDCVVAVGGGVIGDLSGFAASVYMRGIDFYNIPTTLLAEIDSSIGGKTAVNYGNIKNPIGSFYQPKAVVIDPDVLKTLEYRQIASGLAECIKMALTFDKSLFEFLESADLKANTIETVITAALKIKKSVVEQDEKEAGLRRVLNFGHTLGHAIESLRESHALYHGECVALGMLPMCSDTVRQRLIPLLQKFSLPTTLAFDKEAAKKALMHDKKSEQNGISCIFVEEIGSYTIKKLTCDELFAHLDYYH